MKPSFIHRAPAAILMLALVGGAVAVAGSAGRAAETPAAKVPALDERQTRTWVRLWEEQQAMELVIELSRKLPPASGKLVIEGATVIPMTGASAATKQTVVVEGGRFTHVGVPPEGSAPAAVRIDAGGQFLVPGLTESHAHTIHSPGQLLVYLTRGVTTLREMAGYPWMLEARSRAERQTLLIPNLYVAGSILSHRPSPFYMTGVESAQQARRLVREQAADGYDFIKIHNSMPDPMFGAIFEAAREAGLDVVGHIPNEIPIARAVAAGMRTNEHFKGYIYDATLEITDQDYLAATRGSELWNTPTFTTYHEHLRGAASRELADREGSLPLVPRWLRRTWQRRSEQEVDELTALRQTIYPKSRRIFAELRKVTDRFLAGTDTGSYAYLVPGYALQEEVRIFESLGLTPYEALATATVNPARALKRESDFGTIEVGKRADFVLLAKDPLQGTAHLAEVVGVGVRGLWLDRQALATLRTRLAEIFADDHAVPEPTRNELERFIGGAERLVAAGWPYPRYILEEIGDWLEALGQTDLAARAKKLMDR